MRTELKPLINKPVVVFGHVTRVIKSRERACISKPRIYPWDIHKTSGQQASIWEAKGQPERGKPVKTDHLWLFPTAEEKSRGIKLHETGDSCLYEPIYANGYLQKYTRADGTEDIGLKPVAVLTIQRWEQLLLLEKQGEFKALLKEATAVEREGSILFCTSPKKTPKEMERRLRQLRQNAERQLAKSI
jgi:hypothetical protein|tara:strand:+ start:90 stop:653 length:564 start_codon:yes stop_codon:yes gene_type:complete